MVEALCGVTFDSLEELKQLGDKIAARLLLATLEESKDEELVIADPQYIKDLIVDKSGSHLIQAVLTVCIGRKM